MNLYEVSAAREKLRTEIKELLDEYPKLLTEFQPPEAFKKYMGLIDQDHELLNIVYMRLS